MPELHEVISAYVPLARRFALMRGQPLPERATGAVLFADISGFTPLTAVLAQELGPERGVEMLSDQLNQVYGALINKVHQYGGSVISFGGDAFTCWFHEDDGIVATAVALAMQRIMIRFSAVITPNNAAIPFAIKISVAAGELSWFLVGQPRIMTIDVMAGRLMDRVAEAGDLTEQDEILLGAEVAAVLDDSAIVEWRTGESGEQYGVLGQVDLPPPAVLPDMLPQLSAEQSRDWLLPPVYQRLSQGLGDFLAELRPAVALFAKFDGIDYDNDPNAGDKLNDFICWVQETLARYEGYLLQIIMGDKGSHFYALFGAPIAHEDDEARAVASALDLQNRPDSLAFIEHMQIGISQGMMYVGSYGGYQRRTYSGLGEQVNMAARLMSKAGRNEIWVSEPIQETAVRYAYTPKGLIKFKGIEEPQPVFQVNERRAERKDSLLKGRGLVEMVGRDAEKAVLVERLRWLENGRSSRTIVEGEAGIGKSRLVADLQAIAGQQGVSVLLGAGDAIEQHTPYHAWRSVFRTLFGVAELDDDEEIKNKVLVQLPDSLQERAPLLNAVLPLHLPENALTSQLAGDVRAVNTRELLVTLLEQIPDSPHFLLILEDGHWFDSASWALLEAVHRALDGIMLVLVTRPLSTTAVTAVYDTTPPEYRRLHEDPDTAHLLLTMLQPHEATTLVCRRLGIQQLPPIIDDLIQERAEGHPFFSEELAYALRDSGLIRVENGRCDLLAPPAAFQTLEFPDTIQGVITSRIDKLDPGQQLTLKVASVIGRVFLYKALHNIHPVDNDRERLRAYLETLDELDITPLETPEPEMSYIFKHVTIQEVAYSLLLFAQRKQLHQHIAEWVEASNAIDLVPHYPLLAHHWSRAEVPEKAILYLENAGQEAFRNGAFREVIDFIQEAVVLAETLPPNRDDFVLDDFRRAKWQLLLGDAHFGLGQLTESRKYFLTALDLLGWPMPEKPLARTVRQLGIQVAHYLWLVAVPEKIRFFFDRPTPEDNARKLTAAHAYEPLGLVYYFSSETNQAVYTALHRFILAKKATEATSELSRGYASVCGIFMLVGLHRFGLEYGRQARRIARQINDIPALAWAYLSTSVFTIGVGKWHNIEGWLKKGVELNQRLLDKRNLGDTVGTLINVLFAQDKYQESAEASRQLQTLGRESGNLEHVAWGITGEANATLRLGDPARAIELYQQSLTRFKDIEEDYVHEAETIGMLALAYLREGRLDEAEALVEQIVALIPDQIPSSYVLFPAFAAVSQTYITIWEQRGGNTAVQQKLARSIKALNRFARHHPIGKPRSLTYAGKEAWLRGNKRKAFRLWRKAIKAANQKEMRYEQGLAHWMVTAHLDPTAADRDAYLTVAKQRFAEIGAQWELAQLLD